MCLLFLKYSPQVPTIITTFPTNSTNFYHLSDFNILPFREFFYPPEIEHPFFLKKSASNDYLLCSSHNVT